MNLCVRTLPWCFMSRAKTLYSLGVRWISSVASHTLRLLASTVKSPILNVDSCYISEEPKIDCLRNITRMRASSSETLKGFVK